MQQRDTWHIEAIIFPGDIQTALRSLIGTSAQVRDPLDRKEQAI